MDPHDPEVLGQHEVDTEDPIFQEYIIARRTRKGPEYTPSSFNFDEVQYCNKDEPRVMNHRTQGLTRRT
jgi:hypothetical protein